ncbi:right-handed parallel beta-helix repeat-containing protein [Alkalinema pantanalense CENA528]|uniref:right-handed parallel beta-helix repeat-containing protein n=1 Tax=Alkalinema pantanalense TaxID=1620705 RepID=UPI003D6F09B9
MNRNDRWLRSACLTAGMLGIAWSLSSPALAGNALRVVVNSNQDTVQPDDVVTLREAIALVNGMMSMGQLTPAEKKQVSRPVMVNPAETYGGQNRSMIQFALPQDQTQILLTQPLPLLTTVGMTIDGTSQPEYQPGMPIVALQPAPGVSIARGLSILADGVTVRGLQMSGFRQRDRQEYLEPSGNITIGNREQVPEVTVEQDAAPKDVVIEQNVLGTVAKENSSLPSGFGVYVWNSAGTTIQNNRIVRNQGSGIVTGVMASNLGVLNNEIAENGLQGMPDGIRLEGKITNSKVLGNQIVGNGGSGIYLFKSEGAIEVRENTLKGNGKKVAQAAIYLMGNDHRIVENRILEQAGAGVVMAAYPETVRNQVVNNQFGSLQGLSLDLVARHGTGTSDYQNGDGRNLTMSAYPSRSHSANRGMDAPQLISPEFLISLLDGSVELVGSAVPNSDIEIYRVQSLADGREFITEVVATAKADGNGKFVTRLEQVSAGDRLSAVASHPDYGTSEASRSAVVRSIGSDN